MKKLFVKLLLLALSLIASVILLELSIRVFLPVYDPRTSLEYKYYPQDDVILCLRGFSGRMWKNTGDYNVAVSINQDGFRDKKNLSSSAWDDIFVVGDSFAFGWGIEEDKRFSNLLESILGRPVFNICTPSGKLSDYQKLLVYAQKKGAKIRNVVLAVCMENDLIDYNSSALERVAGDVRQDRMQFDPKSIFMDIKSWFVKNSAAYQAFTVVAHRNLLLQKIAVRQGLIIENYAGMQKNTYSDKVLVSSSEKIAALCRQFNTLVVLIPSRGLWVGGNKEAEAAVHNTLVSLLHEHGVRVVDLRAYFEEGGNPLEYHFKDDGHWNEKGHLKAAQITSEFLSKNWSE